MKKLQGRVAGKQMVKTAVVIVKRLWQHPVYKKRVTRSKRYLAHDEIGVKVGEKVIIQETKPISKRKRWQVIKRLK